MIFALGDTHLSFNQQVTEQNIDTVQGIKPMSVFGDNWDNHPQRIYHSWHGCVSEEDTVLLAGDISWAERSEQASYDLDFLAALPGKKILIRGNHDYWWNTIGKVRQILPRGMTAIQNDCQLAEGWAICGTRGWICPNDITFTEHDEKIFRREVIRLELSLKQAPANRAGIIVMMHYMPANFLHEENEMIQLLMDYGVQRCIYGHLHYVSHERRLPDEKWGIRFSLVSADYLQFRPLPLF